MVASFGWEGRAEVVQKCCSVLRRITNEMRLEDAMSMCKMMVCHAGEAPL